MLHYDFARLSYGHHDIRDHVVLGNWWMEVWGTAAFLRIFNN